MSEQTIRVGSIVRVGPQEDARLDFMVRGYLGRVTRIEGDLAEVDSDGAGRRQSVSFRAMLPLSTLTVAPEAD